MNHTPVVNKTNPFDNTTSSTEKSASNSSIFKKTMSKNIKNNNKHFKSTRHYYPLRKSTNTLSQQNLILLLALIDLLTCVLILPWDIYRVANYAHDETTLLAIPTNASSASSSSLSSRNAMNYERGFYANYELNAVLTLLRNIIFACEGSVLAAIAFERYMILVEQGMCRSKYCLSFSPRNNNINNNNNNNKPSNHKILNGNLHFLKTVNLISLIFHKKPLEHLQESSYDDTSLRSVNADEFNSIGEQHKQLSSKFIQPSVNSPSPKYRSNEFCQSNTCILSIVITVTIGTCLFECVLIILDFSKWDCQLTEKFRELINQVYILLTFLSFLIITYLYAQIFITVRKNDLRKQRWLTSTTTSTTNTITTSSTSSTTIHQNTNYSSLKLLNKSNSCLKSSTDDTQHLNSSNGNDQNKCHEQHCPTITQTTRHNRLPIRLMKQLSCDQIMSNRSCYCCHHQHAVQTGQWSKLLLRKQQTFIKAPSMSTLVEHPPDVARNPGTPTTQNDKQFIQTSTTPTPTTAIQSPIFRSVINRSTSKRITRSHRTGLMIFISTVVFYATLFPVLWVHFKFWWIYTNNNNNNNNTVDGNADHSLSNNMTTILPNLTTPSSSSSSSYIINSQENEGSFMTTVHHEFYYVNNAVNFFIYSLFNQSFRARLRLLLAKH
ncbi:unnamed protein product [Schistosoma turkestanicum]|nr:unnamed protein product [Schistosoma turkestanicum]